MASIPESFLNFVQSGRIPQPQDFLSALASSSPTSIRINPSKSNDQYEYENVPWCSWGYYLDERPIFTLDPDFHAGKYYVQEASSMSLFYILENILSNMKDPLVLDISAAPGGKSTLISSMLHRNNHGILVSNDIITSRAYTLKYNLAKEGHDHCIVTNAPPKGFSKMPPIFDIILVDAPCSGEGLFRKDPSAMDEWSPENVRMCANRQKDIIDDIIGLLKPNGYLIYSTCTFNSSENIDNVQYFAEKYTLASVPIDFPNYWGIFEDINEGHYGYQFFPHRTKGEGFFISLLQKPSADVVPVKEHHTSTLLKPLSKRQEETISHWINSISESDYLGLDKVENVHILPKKLIAIGELLKQNKVQIIDIGTTIGTFKKDIFIPHHHLALSHRMHPHIERVSLNTHQALQYLKKENLFLDTSSQGWACMQHNGLGLGWAKLLTNRINNYLPNELAIKMDISKASDCQ